MAKTAREILEWLAKDSNNDGWSHLHTSDISINSALAQLEEYYKPKQGSSETLSQRRNNASVVQLHPPQPPLEPIDEKAIEKCLEEPIYVDKHTKLYVLARDKNLIAKLICRKFGVSNKLEPLEEREVYDFLIGSIKDELNGVAIVRQFCAKFGSPTKKEE
jgi:hypothetical protein